MSHWQGKTVVITGAGSGIGRGIALALARQQARLIVTDIDLDAVKATAKDCGGSAEALPLDVRDAAAVSRCCADVVKRHGRLDFMFNNAGLGIAGEVHEIPLVSWDRIIDVNIRGVVHGIHAAYPIMVKQGSGHIINTASLAGLGSVPLFAPYAMTKHAIVGLTRSLRLEAEVHGVRVSALCPAAIETPLLDKTEISGLPSMAWMPDARRFLTRLGGPPYPLDRFVIETLAAIEKNEELIIVPGRARIAQRLGQYIPGALTRIIRKVLAEERAQRPYSNPSGRQDG
ncbi:SDR family oxidoreductase [Oligoflexus tunisiensis]|uniref:SDR family oxidoreductase n=1 Tax=Oligoflexus tunisiensis TaxID=708132 RepID=UPI00114D3263|nr:SDR family oxidoreductase [Oligoflexus tunisiensis]